MYGTILHLNCVQTLTSKYVKHKCNICMARYFTKQFFSTSAMLQNLWDQLVSDRRDAMLTVLYLFGCILGGCLWE